MAWTRRMNYVAHADTGFAEEHRKALQQAELEREAVRQRDLEAQASPNNDPQLRITTWERLHALSLPRSPEHALVRLIARQTGLSVREVRDEQGRRAGSMSAVPG